MAASFRTVRKNTLTIAEDIPEDKYQFRAAPGTMSVGELLSHIAVSTRGAYDRHATQRLTSFAGVDFRTVMQQQREAEAALTTKAQIVDALRDSGEQFATWLEQLSEAQLTEQVEMGGPNAGTSKSRLELLLATKEHEMHERGKLMLIERIIGIVPHVTRQREAMFATMGQGNARQ